MFVKKDLSATEAFMMFFKGIESKQAESKQVVIPIPDNHIETILETLSISEKERTPIARYRLWKAISTAMPDLDLNLHWALDTSDAMSPKLTRQTTGEE